ncbi:MAG: Rpn family recombination-promoting nuclease/putative transposase [Firmicutes bacterium]|nr:Rpn family recombination-promoting nuclease/putative transposase [Bacillota bacterium]
MKYRYPFTNSIVFSLVMRNPEICKGLLQRIISDREIRAVRLHENDPGTEITLIASLEAKQVRFDVLFKDNDAWYDIEMQVAERDDLPKRSRYYHAMMDIEELRRGQTYDELKANYVIFLCCFDPFGKGAGEYRFEMTDPTTGLSCGEERYTIILNSTAEEDRTPEPLREVFRYMNDAAMKREDSLSGKIDAEVRNWNTEEGERKIMTFEQELNIRYKDGLKKGREEGRTEGKLETAKALKRKDIPIEVIAECTGLSAEQIEAM